MASEGPKREALERIMDGKLSEYVRERRTGQGRRSWARIAGDIRADFDFFVSYEALRSWFPEYTDADKAAS